MFKQVTGINKQDEVECGLMALHLQEDMSQHNFNHAREQVWTRSPRSERRCRTSPEPERPQAVEHPCRSVQRKAKVRGARTGKQLAENSKGPAWRPLPEERSHQERLQKPPA